MCVLELAGDKASIEHVWISPRCHRQGVGRALVNRALAAAARAGAGEVEVLSDPFAEMFYVKLGARRLDAVPAPMPGAPGRTVPRLAFVLPPRGHVEVDLRT
jgi:predicted N-acetyltransferase YhbS